MILVDSSAWVEFLRATGSPVHLSVHSLLERGAELATTEIITMEILAGARDDRHRDRLRRMLYGLCFLPIEGLADYESGAEVFRLCRRDGKTPRKLTDCLIAAVAIRNDAEVLCDDADFLAIASCVPLRLAAWYLLPRSPRREDAPWLKKSSSAGAAKARSGASGLAPDWSP